MLCAVLNTTAQLFALPFRLNDCSAMRFSVSPTFLYTKNDLFPAPVPATLPDSPTFVLPFCAQFQCSSLLSGSRATVPGACLVSPNCSVSLFLALLRTVVVHFVAVLQRDEA